MHLPDCNKRNPFLFVPRGTEKNHRQLYQVLTETQTELALLSWTSPSCVIYYLVKRQGQQQVLLGEVFFPTAVFLLSHKWEQVNLLYSADIPQAFFQNMDESFSSSAFPPWATAFPRIQHIFSWNRRKSGDLLFAQFDKLQVPPSATPSTKAAGEKYVQTRSEHKGN